MLDFFDSDAVKKAIRELQDERDGALELHLREEHARAEVRDALGNRSDHIKTEALLFLRDQMPAEVVHNRIPSDSHDATVRDLGDVDDFELITDEIDSLGGGEVVLPIDLTFPETPRMTKAKTRKARRAHLDFATLLKRTFGIDIWTCECGGKRRVLAIITTRRLAAQRLLELGIQQPQSRPPKPMAQAPPQLALAV